MPDDSDVYLRIAQIYRELHRLDKAEENFMKARQYAPGSLEVMYNEAMLYQAQGRFEDAIRVLSDAVTGIKGQPPAASSRRRSLAILYQQLGQLYRDTQNYQAATYTFEELGHLGDEEDRRARMMIMDTYRASKDLPKALQTGREALAKYPADPAIRTSHALLLGENGQTDDAVKMLRAQLHGDTSDRERYLNIAQVYERSRRYKEAEEAARAAEVLPGQPRENEMVWFLLGAIYERQKFFDKAEEQFKKVLAVNPKNAPVLNYYGYMLGDLGIRLDEAEALVQKALKEDPFNGAYLDSLGWIYFKENKLGASESTLRKAVERERHDATIHSHLGDLYAKLGRGNLAAAEPPQKNLVYRTVDALRRELKISGGVEIALKKTIPAGRGLGGGSSDAAAALQGYLRLTKKKLADARLLEIAASLGADVPFFLLGGRALGVNKGDEIYPLPDIRKLQVLIVSPNDIHVPTPEASLLLEAKPLALTNSAGTSKLFQFCALSWSSQGSGLSNDFEGPVFQRHPRLDQIKRELLQKGATEASLAGSGSAVFGVFPSPAMARRAAVGFPHDQTFVCETVSRDRYARLMRTAE